MSEDEKSEIPKMFDGFKGCIIQTVKTKVLTESSGGNSWQLKFCIATKPTLQLSVITLHYITLPCG